MTATTSSPEPNDYPYKWAEIGPKLYLPSDKQQMSNVILSPSFLEPWVAFRDLLPLRPGIAVPLVDRKDKDGISTLVTNTYDMMDCMGTCKYDRPTLMERKAWRTTEHAECLMYQSARNFARVGERFHVPFQRTNLKNEPGRKEAFHRLRGLVMLICNLTFAYTSKPPGQVIQRIEAAAPAADPSLSPILEVRVKWQLEHLGVDELRRKVLDPERKGKEEKEWLISILMGKEAVPKVAETLGGVETKKEGGALVARVGVKRSSSTVDDLPKKKKGRTIG